MALYNIADLNIEMDIKYDLTKQLAQDYLVREGSLCSDFTIAIIDEQIDHYTKLFGTDLYKDRCEYVLIGSTFNKKILDFDAIMLHSSAVVVDNKAYIFSADSGVGKSTHTALWLELLGEKAYIINDDKPVIRYLDGKLYVYGSPFSGKNFINRNARAEIGGICFIERAEQNFIDSIKVQKAIPLMLKQTVTRLELRSADKMLSVIDKILTSAKVYKMGCTPEISAAELAYKVMSEAVK